LCLQINSIKTKKKTDGIAGIKNMYMIKLANRGIQA